MKSVRNRKLLVCVNCKRCKTKCDRKNPCSFCTSHDYVCEYLAETNPVNNGGLRITKDQAELQIAALKKTILHLEQISGIKRKSSDKCIWDYRFEDFDYKCKGLNPCPYNEKLLIHNQYDSFNRIGNLSHRFYGPLSWQSLVLTDTALSPIIYYRHGEVTKRQKDVSNKLISPYFASIINDNPIVDEQVKILNDKSTRNPLMQHEPLTKTTGVPSTGVIDIMERARAQLPKKNVMWTLIDRFFHSVYGFLPLIDQTELEAWVGRVVGLEKDDTKPEALNLVSRMDIVMLGILLMVLRFAYLSSFMAVETPTDVLYQETAVLRENPIPNEVFEVAKLCLYKFDYLRMCNIKILQLALFLKSYYVYAPELGITPEDTALQSFTGLLTKMAMSLGLHHVPRTMNCQGLSPKQINMMRRMWYYIVYLELQGAISNGSPMTIHSDNFDTLLPGVEVDGDLSRNEYTERTIPQYFDYLMRLWELSNPLLNQIASFKNPVMLSTISQFLSDCDVDLISKWKLPFDSIRPLTLEGSYRTIAYFETGILYSSILFRLFLQYEKLNTDITYYYFKKTIMHLIVDLVKVCDNIEENFKVWFLNVPDLFLIPPLESYMHRGIIILQSFLFRCRFAILEYDDPENHSGNFVQSSERYELLKETFELADRILAILINAYDKLSRRYYYSWRCSVAQQSIAEYRNGTAYYLLWKKGKESSLKFTSYMIEDLNKILSKILESSKESSIYDKIASPKMWSLFENELEDTDDFWNQIFPDVQNF